MLIKIENYLTPFKIPSKVFAGRYPPNLPRHSPILKEWYEEVADYCINGITIKGRYYNPLLYHWLNVFSLIAEQVDDKGNIVGLNLSRPLYCSMDHYFLDYCWDAKKNGMHIAVLTGRGFGKTYLALNIIQREYTFFSESSSIISSHAGLQADTDWGYIKQSLNVLSKTHPEFKLKTIHNNDEIIMSGYKVATSNGEVIRGNQSEIRKVIYGKNPDATRSMRPNVQLVEEFGAFPGKGKGSLENVLFQSEGSTVIGGNYTKTFQILLGTGGSIDNDMARVIHSKPEIHNMIVVPDFGKKTGLFIPTHYKYAGTWEKTGFPDIEKGLVEEKARREKLKREKMWKKLHQRQQEFPINYDEVFLRKGTNSFNQDKITTALTKIYNKDVPEAKRGMMREVRDNDNNVVGFDFVEGQGNVYIIEEPQRDKSGAMIDNLYIAGLDSIDQGLDDSVSSESDSSHLVMLVKKRLNNYFNDVMSSTYVAWYDGRSHRIIHDYEQIVMMLLWYNCKVNIEYSKIAIKIWMESKGYAHLLRERPRVSGSPKYIGTTTALDVIKHQDILIGRYIDDYYDKIYIEPLLLQLRDYDQSDRRKFDFVVAMGLTELADEDMYDKKVERVNKSATENMTLFGYYRDRHGKKRYGKIPNKKHFVLRPEERGIITYYDKDGNPHYDGEKEG